jgi:bifunctional non-homologous end joining protein LigD
MADVTVGCHPIHFSKADKTFFPGDGITKADLVDYYEQMADTMVVHLRGRPLMIARYPDGIAGKGFYQKDVPDYFPDWIHRVDLAKEQGTVTHVVCDEAGSLVYLAAQACITPHVWLSRADRPHHPDRLVFDLDPSGNDFSAVRAAAQMLGGALEGLGLPSYVQLTGSRGLHVVVPLDRRADFGAVRNFARDVAVLLAARDPGRLTIEQRNAVGACFSTSCATPTAKRQLHRTRFGPFRARPLPRLSSGMSSTTARWGRSSSPSARLSSVWKAASTRGPRLAGTLIR